jgi:hypothetical protein
MNYSFIGDVFNGNNMSSQSVNNGKNRLQAFSSTDQSVNDLDVTFSNNTVESMNRNINGLQSNIDTRGNRSLDTSKNDINNRMSVFNACNYDVSGASEQHQKFLNAMGNNKWFGENSR